MITLAAFADEARGMAMSERASTNPGHEERAALWAQIASEVDAYLAAPEHDSLFETHTNDWT